MGRRRHLESKKTVVTEKGHLRYTGGPHRRRYVHRVVIENLLKEQYHPIYGDRIPEGFVVHHLDFIKQNNTPLNLCMMDEVIHAAITYPEVGRDISTGKFSKEAPPDWVLRREWPLDELEVS